MKKMKSIFWGVVCVGTNQITYNVGANKLWTLAIFKSKDEAKEFVAKLGLDGYKIKEIRILPV